jgi:SAM-dependent methyltransferase
MMLNQLVRYEPVLRLVREAGGESVLEVGAGPEGLLRLLGGERVVTAVDVAFDEAEVGAGRVVADARELPFPDASFDVVVALDMLEHVAAEDRPRVVDELARTARRRLVVGCPAGAAALEVDRRLARMLDRRGESYAGSWLEEHLEHGFPELDELVDALRRHGTVRVVPNENVVTHELLMRAEMTRRTRPLVDLLERALDPVLRGRGRAWRSPLLALVRGLDRGVSYRTIVVADRP